MTQAIGWAATGLFVASYLVRRPRRMLAVQVTAALLWIAYGGLTGAAPVIVANTLVAAAACLSLWRRRRLAD